jgi:hypothetical protein
MKQQKCSGNTLERRAGRKVTAAGHPIPGSFFARNFFFLDSIKVNLSRLNRTHTDLSEGAEGLPAARETGHTHR